MVSARSLVNPTSNPALERALRETIARRSDAGGSLGELEPLAVRLGLMQNTLRPQLREPQLLMFAADHGLAVDGLPGIRGRSTAETVRLLLSHRMPLTAFALAQQLGVTVVDCGMAEDLGGHEGLLMRKIAHGTRNARVTSAMSVEQAHAAMRAGMEIGDKLRGNAAIFAGVGVGAHESAALVLSRLANCPVRDLVISGPDMDADHLARLLALLQVAQARHRDVTEPVEVLAAFGGFDIAVMVGAMLMAASKRHLLLVDGMPACAALLVASRIAPPVTDYCVFCRSHRHRGLDQALHLFRASALLELGLESVDGCGATLAWPLVRSAVALLSEVADGDDGPPGLAADRQPEPYAPEPAPDSLPFGPSRF